MRIRRLKNCPEIVAGDDSHLRELLHPDRDYPFDGRYSLAYAVLPEGASSLRHRLTSDEVYYIIKGDGEMHVNDDTAEITSGDVVEIPPNAVQWIANTSSEDLIFLCIVDPAWRTEDEEILS